MSNRQERRRAEREAGKAFRGSGLLRYEGQIAHRECRIDLLLSAPHGAPPDGSTPLPRRPVSALVDTGCTITSIRPDIAQQLGLPQIDTVRVHTASTGDDGHACPLVVCRVRIAQDPKFTQMLKVAVAPMRDEMLFGMDLLAGGVLVVDTLHGIWHWTLGATMDPLRPKG